MDKLATENKNLRLKIEEIIQEMKQNLEKRKYSSKSIKEMLNEELFTQNKYLSLENIEEILRKNDDLEIKMEKSLINREAPQKEIKKKKFYEPIVLLFDVPPNEELVNQLKRGKIFEKKSKALKFLYLQYKNSLDEDDECEEESSFNKIAKESYVDTRRYIFFLKVVKVV